VIARTDTGVIVLDLDGDMNERTGWNVFFLHMESLDKAPVGAHVKAGQRIGHPSCEGGESTGTHVHMARKYNGEWISAGGGVPYNLEGWIVSNGSIPYLGYLERNGITITACVCSDQSSQIRAEIK
jgi:murein DD-endopeptidase MepM/ murein hydrolase activator NlpD